MCKCEKEREREWRVKLTWQSFIWELWTKKVHLQPYSKTSWLVYFYLVNISQILFPLLQILSFISSILFLLPLKNVGHWMAWFVKFCGQCVRLSFSTSSDILLKIGVSPFFSRARCITMYFFSFAPFFQSPLCLLFVVGTLTSLIASDQLLNERKEKDPLT